jgi:hypothetical protein
MSFADGMLGSRGTVYGSHDGLKKPKKKGSKGRAEKRICERMGERRWGISQVQSSAEKKYERYIKKKNLARRKKRFGAIIGSNVFIM